MDRHPRRHGQALGRGSRVRLGFALLPVICLAVALAAARLGLGGRDGGVASDLEEVAASAGSDIEDAATSDDAVAAGGMPVLGAEDDAAADAPGEMGSSALSGDYLSREGAFLDELARDAAQADLARDGVAARQMWTEERSLPETAADVLRAYADESCASLAMSGYLDIWGDVWGAIVRDARGWVDMVSVTAGENDTSCDVSVVRLMPQTGKSQDQLESEGS